MLNRQPPLILIAADDQAVCEALQFALRLEGLSVHTHRDATALLRDPDLSLAACVIIDDRRPHLDGFELLNQLRNREMRMPAILLTNHATGRLSKHAANAGIRVVLEKPLLDNVLVDSIQTILVGR
jgi:two-component system response regulator FixJ